MSDNPWESYDNKWGDEEDTFEEEDTIDVEYDVEDEDFVYEDVNPRQRKKRTVGKKVLGFSVGMFLTGAANAIINYALKLGQDD